MKVLKDTEAFPALFLGHGSPMNAIEDNEFTQGWYNIAKTFPKPSAILCISAHWETNGTFVTAMDHPTTIHDFGGFPRELYEVDYPAPGCPELAEYLINTIKTTTVKPNDAWGLDHGCWSVIKNMYPQADVPIVQLSLNKNKSKQFHYDMGRELKLLRNKGVLIVGSGNLVHNLRAIDWNNINGGYKWAVSANEKLKQLISDNNIESLLNYQNLSEDIQLAISYPDHYFPLHYILGLRKENESVAFFNDKCIYGSLSMTSFIIR